MRTFCHLFRRLHLRSISQNALRWLVCVAALGEFSATSAAADDTVDLAAIERRFQSVADRVGPSVVSIRVERQYFAPIAENNAAPSAKDALEHVIVVNGSGSIVSSDGLILTNEHVIQAATTIEVVLAGGERLTAGVVAADARSDLAVLKIKKSDLTPVSYCEWPSVRRGQWAFVLGNPYGLGGDGRASVAVGIVSNLGRRLPGLGEVDDRFYGNMIQTTAAINPGNSGGPLFNLAGELVGVVTAMHTRSGQSDGIGFAIPMTPAKRSVIERLMRGETIEYGYIGLSVRDADADHAPAAGPNVVAVEIESDGPASKADIRVGDVILALNGASVQNASEMAETIGLAPVGSEIAIHLRRDKKDIDAKITVERRNVSNLSSLRTGAILWRGLRLTNAPAAPRGAAADVPAGVMVIDVVEHGPGARARLRVGDVIEQVGGSPVADVLVFRRKVSDEKGAVALTIRGAGQRVIDP